MMKPILYLLSIPFFFFSSCEEQVKPNFRFNEATFGGKNLHGELFQKRYKTKNESSITYGKWVGKKVSSNQEVEALLKVDPNCEAILFEFLDQDTLNNFELTNKIGEFKNLKFLEIHSNRITKYPKSIENLTNLDELVLQIKQRKKIEFSFSKFKNLRHLTIHFADDLSEFPTSIFECRNLETLKLFRLHQSNDNTLAGIEKLKKLKEIYIWDSGLTLPDIQYDFPQLETLVFDRMRQKLPNYFYSCLTLKNLTLNGVSDTIDLDKVSEIKNLENLNLHYQRAFIGKLDLKKLEHLDITSFTGSSIDIDLSLFPSLKSLVFWSCDNLTAIKKVSNNNLKSITIINNEKLEKIHFDEQNLKSLEEIVMRSNDNLSNKPAKINGVPIREHRR